MRAFVALADITCLMAIALAAPAVAQSAPSVNASPLQNIHDVNDIDLIGGVLRKNETLVSYGDPGNPLSVSFQIASPGPAEGCCSLNVDHVGYVPVQDNDGYYYYLTSPTGSASFFPQKVEVCGTSGTTPKTTWAFFAARASLNCTQTEFFYSDRDGNKLSFFPLTGVTEKETFHNGEKWKYYYLSNQKIKFIVSNRGYGIQISYGTIERVSFYNKSYIYCDEAMLIDCVGVSSLPTTATITTQTMTNPYLITETVNRPDGTGFTFNLTGSFSPSGNAISSFTTLGVPNSTRTYTYIHGDESESAAANDSVATVNDGLQTWTYVHLPPSPGYHLSMVGTVVTDPTGHQRQGWGTAFAGVMEDYVDEFFRAWVFEPTTDGGGYQNPEGDGVAYVRDARGNPIETHIVAKTGSGIADIVSTASYPANCTNLLTCNKPTWTRDAKGNQTDFTYDATHGGILTQTGPADANGIRPETRYTYVQRYAWILNSSGGYVHADGPIWLLDSESFCRASAATGNPSAPCTGNDEVKTSYEYGPDSGPNNLYLRGKAVTADGVTLRTCYGNDRNGRRISETSPRGTVGLASCP